MNLSSGHSLINLFPSCYSLSNSSSFKIVRFFLNLNLVQPILHYSPNYPDMRGTTNNSNIYITPNYIFKLLIINSITIYIYRVKELYSMYICNIITLLNYSYVYNV